MKRRNFLRNVIAASAASLAPITLSRADGWDSQDEIYVEIGGKVFYKSQRFEHRGVLMSVFQNTRKGSNRRVTEFSHIKKVGENRYGYYSIESDKWPNSRPKKSEIDIEADILFYKAYPNAWYFKR